MNIYAKLYFDFASLAHYNIQKGLQNAEIGNNTESQLCIQRADNYLEVHKILNDISNHYEDLNLFSPKIDIVFSTNSRPTYEQNSKQESKEQPNKSIENETKENHTVIYSCICLFIFCFISIVGLDDKAILNGISSAISSTASWISSGVRYFADTVDSYTVGSRNKKQNTSVPSTTETKNQSISGPPETYINNEIAVNVPVDQTYQNKEFKN